MRLKTWHRWGLVVASAGLQVLIFPTDGPLPQWRSWLAWIALVPLLLAILARRRDGTRQKTMQAIWLGYGCGILWYAGNCYWIYQTMYLYGGMGKPAALGILVLFSLYLGLYHALFGGLLALTAKRGSGYALLAAPFLWVAVELARARITSFPWDQLGMSQIDGSLNGLAPLMGVYGISFVLAGFSAGISAVFLLDRLTRFKLIGRMAAAAIALAIVAGYFTRIPITPVDRRYEHAAVLLQPNGVEGDDRSWSGTGYDRTMREYVALTEGPSAQSYVGRPADIILWPESPAPLFEQDPRFQAEMSQMARQTVSALIIGDVARAPDGIYNSASFFTPDGKPAGRYDKIHLVPFGEYIPFAHLFTFAKALTADVGDMAHGKDRVMFRTGGHTFGVFICYESIFADEVRLLAKNGADVLVNISDDGWYGDTSAPWQHLNMARMRAIENHRWLLRDTNNGVTAVIDPEGHYWMSAPRHERAALLAGFGYVSDTTFYTRHGDWFAYAVTILGALFVGFAQFASGAKARNIS